MNTITNNILKTINTKEYYHIFIIILLIENIILNY
jgi:hypothetical protein